MIYQPSIYPLVGWFGWGFGNGQGQRPAHLQPAQLCRQEEQEDEPQGDFRQDAAQAQGFRIKFFLLIWWNTVSFFNAPYYAMIQSNLFDARPSAIYNNSWDQFSSPVYLDQK